MMNIPIASAGPTPALLNPGPGGAPADAVPVVPQDAGVILQFGALPFADLMGDLAQAMTQDTAPVAPVDAASAGDSANAVASETDSDSNSDRDNDAAQQPPLMAAMTYAMPLMPASLAAANTIANVMPRTAAADGAKAERDAQAGGAVADTARTVPAAAIGAGATVPAVATMPAAAGVASDALANLAPRVSSPARPAAGSGATATSAPATDSAPAAAPRYAATAAAVADAAADAGTKTDAPAARDSAGVSGLVPGAHVAAAPQDGRTDTVPLSGPPTAWRQSLREALGERLQVQAGNGLEQAVIRLDPPQLGRVEISIRHSAGSLEVTLSATNGEVLRQLHGVSDSLRNDLAQRQYLDVAVTVAPAPRSAAANPFSGDAQGRGRQPGQDQEQHAPGLALFDDNADAAGFSLNGRT